jgi:hypothetical protein
MGTLGVLHGYSKGCSRVALWVLQGCSRGTLMGTMGTLQGYKTGTGRARAPCTVERVVDRDQPHLLQCDLTTAAIGTLGNRVPRQARAKRRAFAAAMSPLAAAERSASACNVRYIYKDV